MYTSLFCFRLIWRHVAFNLTQTGTVRLDQNKIVNFISFSKGPKLLISIGWHTNECVRNSSTHFATEDRNKESFYTVNNYFLFLLVRVNWPVEELLGGDRMVEYVEHVPVEGAEHSAPLHQRAAQVTRPLHVGQQQRRVPCSSYVHNISSTSLSPYF